MTENYKLLVSKSIESHCLKETILNRQQVQIQFFLKKEIIRWESGSEKKYDRENIEVMGRS